MNRLIMRMPGYGRNGQDRAGDREKPGSSGETASEELKILHKQAVDGDKEAVKKAHKLAKKMYEENPHSHLAEAYIGSTTSLLGRDAVDPNERFKLAMEGVKLLDKVVSQEPHNIEIRILRGYVSLRLPEMFFHRTLTAIEDLKYLVDRYEDKNDIFTPEFYWQLLYDLGTAYKTVGKASESEKVWNRLVAVSKDPKYRSLVGNTAESDAVSWSLDESGDWDKKKIAKGAELHSRAALEGKKAINRAYEYFEKAYAKNQENPLLAAYYGDCMSMMGMESGDSAIMFANAIKAMKILDEAVNKAPDCIEIRLLRADQSFRLPESFFKRTTTAITDLEYLINRYDQDSSVFSKELYCSILFLLGKAFVRMDMAKNARVVWGKLSGPGMDPKYKKLVAMELRKIEPIVSMLKGNAGSDKKALLEEGIRLHDLAVAGNKMASKAAFEVMQKAFELDKADPIVEGYYGSSMALMARDSSDTTILFTHSIKGMQHVKRAVSRDSNNITLRLIRAYLIYSLPEFFFHMSGKAAKDFKFLKTTYEQNNDIFPKETYWQILYDLGVCYHYSGDIRNAEKVWKKLMMECSDPKYKELVQSFERRDI